MKIKIVVMMTIGFVINGSLFGMDQIKTPELGNDEVNSALLTDHRDSQDMGSSRCRRFYVCCCAPWDNLLFCCSWIKNKCRKPHTQQDFDKASEGEWS